MRSPRIVVVTGTSASGKTALVEMLLERGIGGRRFMRPITATDRRPRPGEQHGVHYYFLSRDEFARMAHPSLSGKELVRRLEAGQTCIDITRELGPGGFYEYALVYGNLKGIPRFSVERVIQMGAVPVLILDIQGARSLAEIEGVDGVYNIFIAPHSLDVIESRILAREPDIPRDELRVRVESARHEIETAKQADYIHDVIINRNHRIEETFAELSRRLSRALKLSHQPYATRV